MSRNPHGSSHSFSTTRMNSTKFGTAVPKSFEPKSSSGHLASFCYHCNQRIECHHSYWAIGVGTLRVCDEQHLAKGEQTRRADEAFRHQLKAQEQDNCRPTRTVANMERYDAPYYLPAEADGGSCYYDDGESRGGGGGYSQQRGGGFASEGESVHRVTKVLAPIKTPFGTMDNNADREQTEPRRGRKTVEGNINLTQNFVGAGAVPSPEPPMNRSNRYY